MAYINQELIEFLDFFLDLLTEFFGVFFIFFSRIGKNFNSPLVESILIPFALEKTLPNSNSDNGSSTKD